MSGALVLLGLVVQLGLQFNDTLFKSPAVLTGFSVSLSIANLGFVLGIIIIAIATIIRNQTYGIKQLLWKLVMMAILVNFGLVITAPIVGFANDMTQYFINATTPSAATGGYGQYVLALTSAFEPQTTLNAANGSTNPSTSFWPAICETNGGPIVGSSLLYAACKITGTPTNSQPNDVFWQQTMALMFDVAFSAIAVFVFLCLAILLIVRYLMLGGLLIVLPLAWLTYVFPKFDNSFSNWWNTFVKWVFFPPLAMFFIYLAFITAVTTNTSQGGGGAATYADTAIAGNGLTNNGLMQFLSTQTGLTGGVFVQFADEVLLLGLMIMGLMFASSLAGKAGSTVVNGATTASKAVGGYVGGRARRHATRAYQKLGGDKINASLQRSRIPLVGVLGRGAANITEGGSKDLIAERSKALGLSGMDDSRLVEVTKGLRREEDKFAAVAEWQKRGKLDKIKEVGGTDFATWLSKNQEKFDYNSQGKLKGDIDKQLMSSEEERRIAREMAPAAGTVDTQAVTDGVRVVDKGGIKGTAGDIVSAKDLAKAARDMDTRDARAIILDPKSSDSDRKNAQEHIAEIENAIKDADDSIANAVNDAISKKQNDVDVKDVNNLLGRGAGQTVKAGDLMKVASEKFWEGKDKGDIGKMRPDWMFSKNPKFGLDKDAIRALKRATAEGIATQTPTHFGVVAGKVDNARGLKELIGFYRDSVNEGFADGKITHDDRTKILRGVDRVLERKLSQIGGGGGGGETGGDGH